MESGTRGDEPDETGHERGGNGGGDAQRAGPARRRPRVWTRSMRTAFLDALSTTCNVSAAARAADASVDMVYTLRRRDEGFAAEWQAALTRGYELVETMMVGHVLAGGSSGVSGGDDGGGEAGAPAIDVEMAMRLLTTHRRRAERGQPALGGRPRIATREEVNAALIAKLDRVERRLGLPALPPLPGTVRTKRR